MHHIHDIFRDCHAQPRSLNAADSRISFPFKRLKDMCHELLAHADARILDTEFIICITLRRTGFLRNAHTDNAARARIFDRITKQVQKHLIQPQFITVDFFIQYVNRVNI